MNNQPGNFYISPAPHLHSGRSVPVIMFTVFISLLPALAFSVYQFGLASLYVTALAVISCLVFELLGNKIKKEPISITDGSAAVTGILFAFSLPPYVPAYIVIAGSFFAIIIVKAFFGGLGNNWINPAAAARIFVMFAWVPELTGTCWIPACTSAQNSFWVFERLSRFKFDALSFATPLQQLARLEGAIRTGASPGTGIYELISPENLKNLFWGIGPNVSGCIGEVPKLALLAGAFFLFARRIVFPVIPFTYIIFYILLNTFIMNPFWSDPSAWLRYNLFHLLTGGFILGAFFMATDMVTSPITPKGHLIFAAGLALITFIIRKGPGYPEGVSFAIVIMNAFVPLINKFSRPAVFGTGSKKSGEKK